ncbi:unnamed protein product [Camellia sinensis]
MLSFYIGEGILLKMALSPLFMISKRATLICAMDSISLKTVPPNHSDYGMVMVVLRINSLSLSCFRCSSSAIENIQSLDLSIIDSILSTTTDRELVYVSADSHGPTTFIRFDFLDNFESYHNRSMGYNAPFTLGNPYNYLGDYESEYEYDVVLGIPSHEFRRILRHIREFACLIVDVFVTDASTLTFSSGPEDLVLTIEDDGCIVWGIEWYRTARLRMTLFNMDSFMEASEHSTFVWMFHCPSWSDFPECPVMLNCPIGHLGNIKYYFDERHDRRFPEC